MNIVFDNRVVIVTGAAHGFGREIAKGFAERGGAVHILDVNAAGLAETQALCGERCRSHVVDVGQRDAVQAIIAKIEAEAGAVDILVNNAGGVRGQVGRPLEEISENDWRTIFDVNLSGAFFMTQAVAPGMKKRRYGRIINISSGAGLGISLTGIQAYASAKAGQIGLTRQLAHELGPWNITVNNVAPGFVRSNPTTERQWEAMGEEGQQKLIQNIAMKRLGAPDDIAAMVMFFASDFAGWVSGQVISVGRRKVSDVEAYLAANADAALADLKTFCTIASVSTDPAYRDGMRAAATFVSERLARAGFQQVEIIETGGNPAVFGEIVSDPALPTVLVYGHYDVQPPDPLEKWVTPPFEPTIRNGRLYARGVSDDKGPMLIPILVVEAFMKTTGRLPVNIKMLVEGEEESGSPHFAPLVEHMRDRLACDLVVSADGAMWRADRPSMTVASRGLSALDVTVTGAAKDLHSGRHGGSAPNPVRVLARLLATLHDADGNITVPGLHDGILPPDPAILDAINAAAFDTPAYFREIGAPQPVPMPSGRDLLTRQWLEPTLELNGIFGGYSGPGTKTVIPSSAGAKITCRLVAGQEPERVAEAIERHLHALMPSGYSLDVKRHGPGSKAFSVDPALPALAIAETLLGDMLGAKALRVAMGATIPIGSVFKDHLGAETIFFSFSTSDEDYHAPNEFFRLENFSIGQIAWARLLERLGQSTSGK